MKYYFYKENSKVFLTNEDFYNSNQKLCVVLNELPDSKYQKYKLDKDNNIIADELENNKLFKKELQTRLMNFCDTYEDYIFNHFLGYKNTTKQILRYKEKYSRAKAGDYTKQKREAIILKGDYLYSNLKKYQDIIEFFRENIADMLAWDELEKVEDLLNRASFDENTTLDDVEILLR